MAKNKSRFAAASAGFDYTAPNTITEEQTIKQQKDPEKEEKKAVSPKKEAIDNPIKEVPKKTAEPETPVKVGRPKGIPKTRVTVYLPTEMTDQLSGAMNIYKGDMAAYISKLISKDLEENGELYKQISSLANI